MYRVQKKMRVHFFVNKSGGGWGEVHGGGGTWGFRERLKTPHLFSKACMSKTNMSIELSAVCLYCVHLHLFLCFAVVSKSSETSNHQ